MLTFGLAGLGLGAGVTLPSGRVINPAQVASLTTTDALTKGVCSADRQYVWDIAKDGNGFWRRLNTGEPCVSISSISPNVHTDPQGGVAVADVLSFRTWTARWKMRLGELAKQDIQGQVALAAHLPPCPAGATADSDQTCYDQSPVVPLLTSLLAPGTFEMFRVPFHVSELKDGRYQKTFVPDTDQRFLIDFAILALSQKEYAPFWNRDNHSSVQKVMDLRPDDFRLSVDGFSLNPTILPTAEEMVAYDGYKNWIMRGGYPLSLRAMQAKDPVNERVGITVCASLRCACPTDPQTGVNWRAAGIVPPDQEVNALPRCIGGIITKKGIQTRASYNDQTDWDVYVALGPNPNERTLALIPRDPTWNDKVGGWLGSQLEKLAELLCGAQPSVQNELQQTQAEKCIDKQQKPCTKGSPGCMCVSPPVISQGSVGLFNSYMSHWCGDWAAENAPPPQYEAPTTEIQVPPEMQLPFGLKWWQWGLVVGGGLAVGGALFSKRAG